MKSKKIWANFSVQDVQRTQKFYTALGFVPNPTGNFPGLASFLFGANDFVIHFFEWGSQIDEYIPSSSTGNEIIFTLSAQSEDEVNAWSRKVIQAGGQMLKEAGRDAAGYYGCTFADPDGHRFNILLLEDGM